MSIWSRIREALNSLSHGEPLSKVFDNLRTPPEQTVGFTIAVIALGAKMAKADGQVTRDEVQAFRRVFHIPPNAEKEAAKVFNLARTDVAGYEGYARKIATMFGERKEPLRNLLEGLFSMAVADGDFHPNEEKFLKNVQKIFGLSDRVYRAMYHAYVPDAEPDPYTVLGISDEASDEEIKQVWRKLVRESHPDVMIARGLPEEAIKLATARLHGINKAYEAIQHLRHPR